MPILTTNQLSIGYRHKGAVTEVQHALNLALFEGELVCLIGTNGSGKSTLLRTLIGLQKPISGSILVKTSDLLRMKSAVKSRMISFVLTDRVDVENINVYQIVALGRFPHNGWFEKINTDDDSKIREAIRLVHLEDKTLQPLNELSDGEKQRVMIAKALAQDTPIILLDEPTAHLDLPNKVEIMLLLHRLAHQTKKAILLSTHELDLALQTADKIWLMCPSGGINQGVPEDMVLNGIFNKAFESNSYYFNAANGNYSINYNLQKKVWVEGDKTRMYWTLRALARAGFQVVEKSQIIISVKTNYWEIKKLKFYSIEDMLKHLEDLDEKRFE